jgi:hypothetical protein
MKVKAWILLLGMYAIFAQDAPKEAWTVVKEAMQGKHGLEHFNDIKADLGFSASTSLSDLTIGTAFKVCGVDYNALKSSNISTTVSSIFSAKSRWGFPILENGQMKMRIEVKNSNGSWERGRWGAPGLMPEWQKIVEAWPLSKGYHPILIETGMGMYYHVPEVDSHNLTRIMIMTNNNGQLLSKSSTTQYQKLGTISELKSEYDKALSNKGKEETK